MKNHYRKAIVILAIGIVTMLLGEYTLIMQPWQNWWQSTSPVGAAYLTLKFTFQNPLTILNGIWFSLLLELLLLSVRRVRISVIVYWVIVVVFYAVNFLKIKYRNESLGMADFSEIQGAGNVINMISISDVFMVLLFATLLLITFYVVVRLLSETPGNLEYKGSRITKTILIGGVLLLILSPLVFSDDFSTKVEEKIGNSELGFSSSAQATINGPVWYFFRSLGTGKQLMNRPDNYNEKAMELIQRKYTKISKQINLTRQHENLKKQTVVYLLSESFTNPERVPGLELKKKVVPNLEKIQIQNIGGTMISSGLGGGTANIEYMTLTGMPVAGFRQNITTPYSQVVPTQKHVPSILNYFDDTETLHPYNGSLYNRRNAYRIMGMQKFITTDQIDSKAESFEYREKLSDKSDYIDDKSAFRELESQISSSRDNRSQFIQLITMQNHLPYTPKMYSGKAYQSYVSNSLPGNKVQEQVETYLNGIHETDTQLGLLLKRLDTVSRPITMVFYGDHWPGIFTFVNSKSNGVIEHSTDYFIWQNQAAKDMNGAELKDNNVVSPASFSAQILEATNVKVTPYMALQTEMLKKVPAIANFTRTKDGYFEFVDKHGRLINEQELTSDEKSIVNDLRLVQYDSIQKNGFLTKNFY